MSESSSNHIISRRMLLAFAAANPGAKDAPVALDRWYRLAKGARWETWADVKASFGDADKVGRLVVFNVGGNKYRIVCQIKFRPGNHARVHVRHVFDHKKYDSWSKSQ